MKQLNDTILNMIGIDPKAVEEQDEERAYAFYIRAEEAKGIIEDFMTNLKKHLFDLAEKVGTKDSKGSIFVQFPSGGYKKEARTSVTIDVEKVKLLAESKGLPLITEIPKLTDNEDIKAQAFSLLEKEIPDAVDYEEAVDELTLETLYTAGQISDEELGSVIDKKVIYALKKLK